MGQTAPPAAVHLHAACRLTAAHPAQQEQPQSCAAAGPAPAVGTVEGINSMVVAGMQVFADENRHKQLVSTALHVHCHCTALTPCSPDGLLLCDNRLKLWGMAPTQVPLAPCLSVYTRHTHLQQYVCSHLPTDTQHRAQHTQQVSQPLTRHNQSCRSPANKQ
jgi:hypothetical protein